MNIIPAKIIAIREIKKKYVCRKCEGTEEERPGVLPSPYVTRYPINGSIPDESLLAWGISVKLEFVLPFYCQTKRLEYIGVPIPRATLLVDVGLFRRVVGKRWGGVST